MNLVSKLFRNGLSIIVLSASVNFSEVVLKPLHAGMAIEYGQMRGLKFFEPVDNSENFTINRTIGWIAQGATINERMDVNLALGGMFFQFFPFNKGFDYSKVRNSAVSIGQASAQYNFGDVATPSLSVSLGLMPYKYNQDSHNLGEYLFRSTPYPTTTINGGWDLINSSYANMKGILLQKDLFEKKWKNDFLISISDETFPLNDINLAYVTSVKLGILELGAGINFNNVLPNSPSLSTPIKNANSYFDYNGVTYSGDKRYYSEIGNYFTEQAKLIRTATQANGADSAAAIAGATQIDQKGASYLGTAKLVDSLNTADTVGATSRLDRKYYTFQGQMLMGRASINLGELINDKIDFKLYTEVDVLGWANYPIFYESRAERMPLMVGVSVPTFGFLDHLNFEVEYWKNHYPIVNYKTVNAGIPVVNFDAFNSNKANSIDITKPYTKDDIKWSVSTKKSIGQYFSIDAQIANDHTRPIRYDFSSYKYETMMTPEAWYYILRLQVNI